MMAEVDATVNVYSFGAIILFPKAGILTRTPSVPADTQIVFGTV